MKILSKHLFIEYLGSMKQQNLYYDGDARTFWTLKDGRQIADCRNETVYRFQLANIDDTVPFVPQSEDDWDEVIALMEAEELARAEMLRQRRIGQLKQLIETVANEVDSMGKQAIEMTRNAAKLRNAAKVKACTADIYIAELEEIDPPPEKPAEDITEEPVNIIEDIEKIRSKKGILECAAELGIELPEGRFTELKLQMLDKLRENK